MWRAAASLMVFAISTSSFAATADLSINLTVTPPVSVDAKANMTYTAVVKNAGPDSANGVVLFIVLPPSSDTVPIAITPADKCGFRLNGGGATCSLGTLASSATVTVTIVEHPAQTGTKTVTARVLGRDADPAPGNNVQTVSSDTKEVGIGDVQVKLTDTPDPAGVDDFLSYALTVTNNGDDDAANVQARLVLPPSARVVSALSNRGTCVISDTTVTCAVGDLVVRGSATVAIEVIPSATGWLYATAAAETGSFDPDTANNCATVRTWVDSSDQRPRSVPKTLLLKD